MSTNKNIVIALPIERLLACSGLTAGDLTKVVNAGYHQAIERFHIVVNPRVSSESSFFSDLSLKPETCIFYVMVKDKAAVGPDLTLLESGTDFELYGLGPDYTDYRFELANVKATVAYRPLPYDQNPRAYEVTAFSSFVPHGGIDIFNYTLAHFRSKYPACDELIVRVIVEHKLVSYYNSKLGFEEYNRVKIYKDRLLESGFQPSFKTNSDFHIADMRRYI